MAPRRRCLAAIASALLVLACGCGVPEEERPALHPTQGSLWINGQPAEGAMLVLHRTGDALFDARGTRPTATVDTAGNFALTTYQDGDGAPAGEYQVAVLWFDDSDSNSPWDKLGGRFADPTRSDIRVSVGPERDTLEPIRIEGVPILARRQGGNSRDLDQTE
jgi:hypothetical protein